MTGAIAGWVPKALAQQADRAPVVGVLQIGAATDPQSVRNLTAFVEGLKNAGWIEGKNVRFEMRRGASGVQQLETFAKELAGLKPDVIVVNSTSGTSVVARMTRDIPVVFINVFDPVAVGLVQNL
jgi:putative tryptophan/tyrosine transport system substrate-binding protein